MTWSTANPTSEQHSYLDVPFLFELEDRDDYAIAATGWHGALLPEGFFLRRARDATIFFNVRTYRRGGIAWPCIVKDDEVELDRKADEFVPIFCFAMEDFTVQPVDVAPPILQWARGKRTDCNKIAFSARGPTISLLEHHLRRGWFGVSETCLKCIYDDYDLAPPPVSISDEVDPTLAMSVDLMIKFDPKVTPEMARHLLTTTNVFDL